MKQGYKETNRKSFQEMKKRVPHRHPCLNVPSALTSGEKALWVQGKGTQESSSRRTSLCSAATQPHTPAQHSLASTQGYCGELQEYHTRASPLRVPPPPSIFPQGSCEAITVYNVPCSCWANHTQESLVCWNKATE